MWSESKLNDVAVVNGMSLKSGIRDDDAGTLPSEPSASKFREKIWKMLPGERPELNSLMIDFTRKFPCNATYSLLKISELFYFQVCKKIALFGNHDFLIDSAIFCFWQNGEGSDVMPVDEIEEHRRHRQRSSSMRSADHPEGSIFSRCDTQIHYITVPT